MEIFKVPCRGVTSFLSVIIFMSQHFITIVIKELPAQGPI